MQRLYSRRQLMLAAAGSALAGGSYAQPAGNGKTVRILVGFPPGQATDTVAGVLAERLRTQTGDNYIVENRPGQGGSLAMGQLAKSQNDGSEMMLTHMSAVATSPHLYKNVPYDSTKRLLSGRPCCRPAVRACSQPGAAHPERAGTGGLCEGEPGQADQSVIRQRHRLASCDGRLQAAHRNRRRPRPVQGQQPRGDRRGLRHRVDGA